jgi:hypothetical protein
MTIIKNNYKYEIVRYYLNKMVVKISPIGVTPTNSEDYPMYVERFSDEDFEEIVYDLSTF